MGSCESSGLQPLTSRAATVPPLDSSGAAQFRLIPAVGNAGVGSEELDGKAEALVNEAVDVDKGRTVEDVAEGCAALSAGA